VHDAARVVHLEDAEAGGLVLGDGDHRHGRVRAALAVGLEHLAVVHLVELVAREDQHVARGRAPHVAQALADGVGGALEPVAALLGLLGGEHAHEARREDVELVRHADVPVEALELNCVSTKMCRRFEFRQLLIGMSISRYLPPIGRPASSA
jgi:hypothetical protein